MSIINNNDFTLSIKAQAAIESICTNLGLQDICVGFEYNGIYPLFNYETQDYVISINLESLESKNDMSGLVDSFFKNGIFSVSGNKCEQVANSENLMSAVVSELEKRFKVAKIENSIYVDATQIENISRQNNYVTVVSYKNCLFNLEWKVGDNGEKYIYMFDFAGCTDFGGIILLDTEHENGGDLFNHFEFNLVQCAGGGFYHYAYLKGAEAVIKVSNIKGGMGFYYLKK